MKIDISKMICEILSGLFLILLILLIAYYYKTSEIEEFLKENSKSLLDLGIITLLFALCYFLGIIIDDIDLLFDAVTVDILMEKCKWFKIEKSNTLLKDLDEHILTYRNNQWSYYTCYRNLLILLIPIEIFVFRILFCNHLNGWAWISILIFLVLEVSFVHSMRLLLKLYKGIAKTIPE
jgi:hypothetical protein